MDFCVENVAGWKPTQLELVKKGELGGGKKARTSEADGVEKASDEARQLKREDLGFAKELRLMLIVQDVLWLATTSVDGGVQIWDANSGEVVQSLGGHQHGVRRNGVKKGGFDS